MYCYISDYTINILVHDVDFGNRSVIQVQFTINVRSTLYKHIIRILILILIILIDIYFQIKSFPHLCNITIYGITNDNVNNETMSYDPVYINATNVNETTTNYTITGPHPSLNYIFTVYIMDLLNNTKNEDSVIFCELITCFLICLHNSYYNHSNLSCPRTHSTVLL